MMTFKTYLNEFNCMVVSKQTFLVFQDVFKTSSRRLQCNNFLSSETSSRRLQDVLAIRLPETSSRRLQDVFKITSQDVFKTFSRHLVRQKKLHINILLRRSNMVLLRYLRQMKYGKAFY